MKKLIILITVMYSVSFSTLGFTQISIVNGSINRVITCYLHDTIKLGEMGRQTIWDTNDLRYSCFNEFKSSDAVNSEGHLILHGATPGEDAVPSNPSCFNGKRNGISG